MLFRLKVSVEVAYVPDQVPVQLATWYRIGVIFVMSAFAGL